MAENGKIELLLADDHALVREGIRSSLTHYPSISIVDEAVNGREALRKCKDIQPHVVLMDLNMPEMSGMEAIPLIRKSCPGVKIIALTVHESKEYVLQLVRAGVHGYVLKDTSPGELVRAVESVARGQAFFSPAVSKILLDDYVQALDATPEREGQLSDREKQVLQLIARGKTSKEIASELHVGTRTVETYRVRLKRKLRARNVAELLALARADGLL